MSSSPLQPLCRGFCGGSQALPCLPALRLHFSVGCSANRPRVSRLDREAVDLMALSPGFPICIMGMFPVVWEGGHFDVRGSP